jgi:hypothetical protein
MATTMATMATAVNGDDEDEDNDNHDVVGDSRDGRQRLRGWPEPT